MYVPVKAIGQKGENASKADLGSENARDLLVRGRVRGDERRDVDGIADGLIARRVDDVA